MIRLRIAIMIALLPDPASSGNAARARQSRFDSITPVRRTGRGGVGSDQELRPHLGDAVELALQSLHELDSATPPRLRAGERLVFPAVEPLLVPVEQIAAQLGRDGQASRSHGCRRASVGASTQRLVRHPLSVLALRRSHQSTSRAHEVVEGTRTSRVNRVLSARRRDAYATHAIDAEHGARFADREFELT